MKIRTMPRRMTALFLMLALGACGGGGNDGPADDTHAATEAAEAAVQPNFVSLTSDTGDYVGGGRSYRYTQGDAILSVAADGGHATVRIQGDDDWSADFQLPNGATKLRTGTFRQAQRYPFNPPDRPGLSWSGEGRGCNTLTGQFTIQKVTYSAGQLQALDLSFEQHCEGAVPALRGQVHWRKADTTTPPGPVTPPPSTLWTPAPGSTPASGNYLYVTSDSGDYIGQGQTHTYTPANAQVTVGASGAHLTLGVQGNEDWSADFQAMTGLTQLQPGYYAGLQRYPFHNPVKGGLNFSGEGRGCNTLNGWFVVDSVSYTAGSLSAVDLRFEQHCEGAAPALRGQLHWVAGDTATPGGPVNPPPAGLWSPAVGATPATGNYVYLVSDPGDYIGQGQTHTYTPADTTIGVNSNGGYVGFNLNGATWWYGDFKAMNTLTQLQPGYYGNLQRYPFHNPTIGGLSWSGDGRGCNTLTGWFVVDSVSYDNGVLKAIDLRFEQHCEGGAPALHGKVHWAQ